VLVALIASGCGGTDAPPATDTATPTPSTDPTSSTVATPATGTTTPAAGENDPGVNEIAGSKAKPGAQVTISAITPKQFSAAHCAKPIMVVFYQPGAVVDEALLEEARAAAATVPGAVTFVYTPRDVRRFGDLISKLGLLSTPGVATVGRDGRIENFWVSYVDRALIQRSLRNAAAAHPCKVTADEVPAAGSAFQDAATVASGGTLSAGTTALDGQPPSTPAVTAAGAETQNAVATAAAIG
jgi:hypothetical protein